MEYVIYNFTDIGIKDIQLKYIEIIAEKSIYGIYCLVLYLIQKISNSEISNSERNNNNKYSPHPGPRKRNRGPGRISSNGLYVPELKDEFELRKNRTFTMVCGGHVACLAGAILYYIYIKDEY